MNEFVKKIVKLVLCGQKIKVEKKSCCHFCHNSNAHVGRTHDNGNGMVWANSMELNPKGQYKQAISRKSKKSWDEFYSRNTTLIVIIVVPHICSHDGF